MIDLESKDHRLMLACDFCRRQSQGPYLGWVRVAVPLPWIKHYVGSARPSAPNVVRADACPECEEKLKAAFLAAQETK